MTAAIDDTRRGPMRKASDMTGSESETFSKKIQLAARFLGCRTLTDLVTRVRTLNPESAVTLDRSYKWAQGRSMPRDPTVYRDLARVLGLGDDGTFVRTASLDVFERRLRSGSTAPTDASVAASRAPGRNLQATQEAGLADGSYATYSPAWTASKSTQIVRGCTHVSTDPDPGGPFRQRVEYVEHPNQERVAFTGDLVTSRRATSVTFDPEPSGVALTMVLAVPGRATPAFGGLLTGQALYAGAPRPVACRLMLVRIRGSVTDPEGGCGFMPRDPSVLADDLAAIGYGGPDGPALAGRIIGYLTAPSTGVLEISQREIEEIVLALALATTPDRAAGNAP